MAVISEHTDTRAPYHGLYALISCELSYIWIVATADIGVFADIGDKMTRYHVPCHDIGFFV
jgi:hypothetical protein